MDYHMHVFVANFYPHSSEEITYIDAFNRGRISRQPANSNSHVELKLLTVSLSCVLTAQKIFVYCKVVALVLFSVCTV